MKLSWLPVSLFGALIRGELSLDAWMGEAVQHGFDAVDASVLFFREPGDMTPETFSRCAVAHGLAVAVLNAYPDFTHPDPTQRERELRQFAAHVKLALRLGARMVRVTAGQAHPALPRAEGVGHAVSGLRAAAELADAAGVTPVFENHSKPGAWSYADFAHPSDIFMEIADQLRDAPVGILFDTANADVRGDDPLRLLDHVADRVRCVHIADTAVRGELSPTVIGTGVVSFEAIFRRLKAVGYDEWLSIEEASGQGPQAVSSAVDFVRMHWGVAGP